MVDLHSHEVDTAEFAYLMDTAGTCLLMRTIDSSDKDSRCARVVPISARSAPTSATAGLASASHGNFADDDETAAAENDEADTFRTDSNSDRTTVDCRMMAHGASSSAQPYTGDALKCVMDARSDPENSNLHPSCDDDEGTRLQEGLIAAKHMQSSQRDCRDSTQTKC